MRSVYDGIKVLQAVRPVAQATGTPTAALNVVALDSAGYNSALFNVEVGTASGTAIAFTVDAQVEECATSGGTWAAVSGATITQITAINKTAQIRVEGLGTSRLRYLRLTITVAIADSRTVVVAGTALFGRAYQEPVSNSATGA